MSPKTATLGTRLDQFLERWRTRLSRVGRLGRIPWVLRTAKPLEPGRYVLTIAGQDEKAIYLKVVEESE